MNPNIEKAFTCHPLNELQQDMCAAIRSKAKCLAIIIDGIVPYSREKSLAMTKLEECVMWANAGIARNEVQDEQ